MTLVNFEGGGLAMGSEPPSFPNKESCCPGQLMGGIKSLNKEGVGIIVHRIRGSSGRHETGQNPPSQHKHPVTGLPPVMCLTGEDI